MLEDVFPWTIPRQSATSSEVIMVLVFTRDSLYGASSMCIGLPRNGSPFRSRVSSCLPPCCALFHKLLHYERNRESKQ